MDYGAILVVVSGISKWYMQMKQDEFHRAKTAFPPIFSFTPIAPSWRHATWKMGVGFDAEADVLVRTLLPCDVERLQMAT